MDRLLPFDQLNVLNTIIRNIYASNEDRKPYRDYIIDEVLEILILSYIYGNEAANQMLDTEHQIDQPKLEAAVYEKIAGEDWKQRIEKYIEDGSSTAEDVIRVAETDAHRIYNEAIMDVGRTESEKLNVLQEQETPDSKPAAQPRKILKTWETMLDDRVRDTHEYLEGQTIPIDEDFYTFDGDFAARPGGFNDPANNINCRCRIVLSEQ